MKLCRSAAVLATLGLLVGPSAGCLSLSMLNRESADTKTRLDSLESRVAALEGAAGRSPVQTNFVQPPTSSVRAGQAPAPVN